MRPPTGAASKPRGTGSPTVQRSWLLMLVNLAFNVVPIPLTTVMITTEMPAAMRPYSMAVAADSSFTKRATNFCMVHPFATVETITHNNCPLKPA
jgi:hypothetical protein